MEQEFQIDPDAHCYANCIRAYAKHYDYVGVRAIFRRMEEKKMQPNDLCWEGLIQCYAKTRLAKRQARMKMRKNGNVQLSTATSLMVWYPIRRMLLNMLPDSDRADRILNKFTSRHVTL